MQCPRCRQENRPEAKFCCGRGQVLSAPPPFVPAPPRPGSGRAPAPPAAAPASVSPTVSLLAGLFKVGRQEIVYG